MKLPLFRSCVFLFLGLAYGAWADDTGSDNPTGVTGQFNGSVTTGGSYDPYTGNASRSITDIVVPGAVGAIRWPSRGR